MRLWHVDLIPVLPSEQLIGQWRELHAIRAYIDKNGKLVHPLVRKVLDYSILDFKVYTIKVYEELKSRGYKLNREKLNSILCWSSPYFPKPPVVQDPSVYSAWHNLKYLKQCYYNLEEKHDCGMINNYEWDRLVRYYQELIKAQDKTIG